MHRTIAILALVCLAAGPLGAYTELVPPLVGFALFVASGPLGLVALIWGAWAWHRRKQRRAVVSALLGLVPVVVLLIPIAGAAGHPGINDITTDAVDPPALSRAPAYPEAFADVVSDAYGDIRPLVLDAPPRQVFAATLALARGRAGWTITGADENAMIVTGVATSSLFRFQDDFVIRVRAAQEGKAVVDMRSRSRAGKGDLGANASRIRAFLRDLEARVTGDPG